MFEDNYPEGLKKVFLIKSELTIFTSWFVRKNVRMCHVIYVSLPFPAAPKLFPMAYNLVKHFLCEETRREIVVLGGKNIVHTGSYCFCV